MKIAELLREEEDNSKFEAWKKAVKDAYPEYADKMKFKGYMEDGKDLINAEVPGLDRSFGVFDIDKMKGEVLPESLQEGAKSPKWRDSDAPDANGKFRDLGIEALADWLIKSRKGDGPKIYGSIQQQIVFNRKRNAPYAKKMEKVRAAVKRKLNAKKD